MPHMAIGIDIVNIHHFCQALESGGQSFVNSHFYPDEVSNKTNEHIAGIFAAKESIMKTGCVKPSDFLAIRIINTLDGKPIAHNAQGVEIEDLEISISHTDTVAVAVAVWNTL